ncbi:MAG: DUF885 family protein [Planctomycetota bacterium]
MPFQSAIIELQEARRALRPVDPAAAATTVAQLALEVERTQKRVEAGIKSSAADAVVVSKVVALRGAEIVSELRRTLEQWYRCYAGYDPLFSWWTEAPYQKASAALQAYTDLLRERVVGIVSGQDAPIVGDPIGREAILQELEHEMIDYSPEQLVTIAEREFAWCEGEMRNAARDMGCGDDWQAALERVKSSHVEPGRQPDLIRDQAREATAFVEAHDLLTVPPLARDIWRIEMMSPERQKESPFFLGGEVILVSFPTDAMAHEDKLMSMRGNNEHFARATVHHELIPGHHLQGFMNDRYAPHRELFQTPFWTEGWALYFEMLFWDLGFARSPENRIGMLFWRMHRCARIIFSLGFHLGTMTPQQCTDFLVDRVGHERANATAEVRRSFGGSYGPLYQVAYMMGGLQFRALHHELCDSGKMANRAFHDAILQGGPMVRARVEKLRLTRDYRAQWKFAGSDGGRLDGHHHSADARGPHDPRQPRWTCSCRSSRSPP